MLKNISRREALIVVALGTTLIEKNESTADEDSNNTMSFKYIRVYADTNGESHFEDMELPMPVSDFGTANVPKLAMTKALKASRIFFVRVEANRPDHRDMDWHTPPDRRFGIWLEGETEVTTSDGEIRRIGPGDIVLAEDTTGKGHKSLNLSDLLLVFISLDDQ